MTDSDLTEENKDYITNVCFILQDIYKKIILSKPDDPVEFMIEYLSHERPLQICLLGPPCSNKEILASMIHAHYGISIINPKDQMISTEEAGDATSVLHELYELTYINKQHSLRKGWILYDFPRDQNDVLSMQIKGLLPDIVFFLEVPDELLQLRCNPDDSSTIKELTIYNKYKQDLISAFQSTGVLIHTSNTVEETYNTILNIINSRKFS